MHTNLLDSKILSKPSDPIRPSRELLTVCKLAGFRRGRVCCCQVVGLGLIAAGAWMHAHDDVYAYLTVFVRSSNDQSLVAAAAIILTAGCILFLASFLGLYAVWKEHRLLMMAVCVWNVNESVNNN